MVTSQELDLFAEELDERAADGVHVSLLWYRSSNQVVVSVRDERSGDSFRFDVDAADALDAFHHPYAYAAFSGVEYGAGSHESSPHEGPRPQRVVRLAAP